MKIALISFGSRGDIAPLIPLAKELENRGHSPYLVANSDFIAAVAKHNIRYEDIGVHIRKLLAAEGQHLITAGSASASLRILFAIIQEQLSGIGEKLNVALKNADILIINERYFLLADSVADNRNIPVMQICFQPKGATKHYPYPYYSAWYFRLLPNKRTHLLVEKKLLKNTLPPVNRIRTGLPGLPPLSAKEACRRKNATPVIQCFSPHIFTPPPDWENKMMVAGNLYVKEEQPPLDAALMDFMACPEAVVYVGFGSMLYDTGRLKRDLSLVAGQLKIKFVWSLNWADTGNIAFGRLSEAVFVIRECNHDALFPLVDCVIHHGGSGTVAAAFRNGKPQLVSWFMLDQEFWAKCVEARRAGINLGNFHRLTPQKLARDISALLENARYKENARNISKKMALENAAVTASDFIESYYCLFKYELSGLICG